MSKTSKCIKCNKNYRVLAGDTCAICNINNWIKYWRIEFPKTK